MILYEVLETIETMPSVLFMTIN